MSFDPATADRRPAHSPAAIGRVAVCVGLAAVVAALPLVVGIGSRFLVEAGTIDSAVTLALAAMDVPLERGYGVAWLFHVAVLALLGGTWLLGAGLVVEGLYD